MYSRALLSLLALTAAVHSAPLNLTPSSSSLEARSDDTPLTIWQYSDDACANKPGLGRFKQDEIASESEWGDFFSSQTYDGGVAPIISFYMFGRSIESYESIALFDGPDGGNQLSSKTGQELKMETCIVVTDWPGMEGKTALSLQVQ